MEPGENMNIPISYLMWLIWLGSTITLIAFAPHVSMNRYRKKILMLCGPGGNWKLCVPQGLWVATPSMTIVGVQR